MQIRPALLGAALAVCSAAMNVARTTGTPHARLTTHTSRREQRMLPSPQMTGLTGLPYAPPKVWKIAGRFRRQAGDEDKIPVLWRELTAVYRDPDVAFRALQQQPEMLNPKYYIGQDAYVFARSKAALVSVLGSEEAALEVMTKNPSLLREESRIADMSADELRSSAGRRQFLDSISKPFPLAILAAGVAFVALQGSGNVQLLDVVLRQ